jgi:hypothetical protein
MCTHNWARTSESVYRICLIHELRKARLRVVAEQLVPVVYDGELQIDHAYLRLGGLASLRWDVEVSATSRALFVRKICA